MSTQSRTSDRRSSTSTGQLGPDRPRPHHVAPEAIGASTPITRRDRKRRRYQKLSYGATVSDEARDLALGSTRGVRPTAPDLSGFAAQHGPAMTRHELKSRTRRYRARRWPLRIMAFTAGGTAAVLMTWSYVIQQQAGYTDLPEPVLSAAVPPGQKMGVGGMSSSKSSTPAVAASRPTQIYLPSEQKSRVISTEVLALDACRNGIDPPTEGRSFGAVWGCTDFEQPGSSTEGPVVLAGHSSPDRKTAFNRLFVRGEDAVGQRVHLKTEASGDRWLTYRIDKVRVPQKTDLPRMREVWGAPGDDTSGRLLLITCRQVPGQAASVQNYVAVASYVGLR